MTIINTYLEIKVQAFAEVDLVREAFVFPHVKRQSVVAVGVFAFREKYGIVEANEFTSRHSLH